MARYRFERTFLTRVVQHWEYSISEDVDHVLEQHLSDLDIDIVARGVKVGVDTVAQVDDWDLTLRVVEVLPDPGATVIPFPRKDRP